MKASHQEFRLANDPDISVDTLAELATSNDELIRGAVALNNATPDYLLQKLFFDKSAHVQDCLMKRVKQH